MIYNGMNLKIFEENQLKLCMGFKICNSMP